MVGYDPLEELQQVPHLERQGAPEVEVLRHDGQRRPRQERHRLDHRGLLWQDVEEEPTDTRTPPPPVFLYRCATLLREFWFQSSTVRRRGREVSEGRVSLTFGFRNVTDEMGHTGLEGNGESRRGHGERRTRGRETGETGVGVESPL